MAIEETKNRDLYMKLSFLYLINQILIILGLNEKIIDIDIVTELTNTIYGKPKIFENMPDLKAITESGKIIIFEFKKDTLRKEDLKQTYNYFKRISCKYNEEIKLIILTIAKSGRINTHETEMITFHPLIFKLKSINKRKDLKIITNKFKNNIKLNYYDCALLATLPLFDTGVSEAEIVKQTCKYIRDKKTLIPEEKLEEIGIITYLNILEYIDENEQEKYMEMIEMPKKFKGFLEKLKEENYNQGIDVGIYRIIIGWIEEGGSIEEFSKRTRTPLDKIYRILDQYSTHPSK